MKPRMESASPIRSRTQQEITGAIQLYFFIKGMLVGRADLHRQHEPYARKQKRCSNTTTGTIMHPGIKKRVLEDPLSDTQNTSGWHAKASSKRHCGNACIALQ